MNAPSLLTHSHFWLSVHNWILLCGARGSAAPFWACPVPNQVLSSAGSVRGLGDACSWNSSWPFKEGRKQLSGPGIASAGGWRVPGEEGAGWWLISLVPCENSHPDLSHSQAAAFSALRSSRNSAPLTLLPHPTPPREHHLGGLCIHPRHAAGDREVSPTLAFLPTWGARMLPVSALC